MGKLSHSGLTDTQSHILSQNRLDKEPCCVSIVNIKGLPSGKARKKLEATAAVFFFDDFLLSFSSNSNNNNKADNQPAERQGLSLVAFKTLAVMFHLHQERIM